MLKSLLKILLLIIVFFNVSSCMNKENENAQEVLTEFYSQYLSHSVSEIQREKLIKQYCTKNMLEILDILYSFDKEEGLIIGIDYDPFLNAQDIPSIENVKIEKQNETDYKVFLWGNMDTFITIKLKKENNNWKIDSLDSYNFERIKKEVESYWNSKRKNNPKVFSK